MAVVSIPWLVAYLVMNLYDGTMPFLWYPTQYVIYAFEAAWLCTEVLSVAGVLLITSLEPRSRAVKSRNTCRLWLRAALASVFFLYLCLIIVSRTIPGGWDHYLRSAISVSVTVSMSVGWLAMTGLCYELGKRARTVGLQLLAIVSALMVCRVYGIWLFDHIVQLMVSSSGRPPWYIMASLGRPPGPLIGELATTASVLFSIFFLALHREHRRAVAYFAQSDV